MALLGGMSKLSRCGACCALSSCVTVALVVPTSTRPSCSRISALRSLPPVANCAGVQCASTAPCASSWNRPPLADASHSPSGPDCRPTHSSMPRGAGSSSRASRPSLHSRHCRSSATGCLPSGIQVRPTTGASPPSGRARCRSASTRSMPRSVPSHAPPCGSIRIWVTRLCDRPCFASRRWCCQVASSITSRPASLVPSHRRVPRGSKPMLSMLLLSRLCRLSLPSSRR
ncbi:hypothetical protein NB717_003184 [Xanthomonas sacchari]|nr:hypothetical protein [Xanthomonas sacchari]MCW0462116.1 hypothetical protein [Xanthomonas sacchari]MCW0465836.1 hypothetical protein [Xanthomonas sacchari]